MRVTFPFEITKFFDTKIDIETGKREIILKKNYAFAVEENFKAIKKYFNELIDTKNIRPEGLNANIVIEPASFNANILTEPASIGSTLFQEGAVEENLGLTWLNWTPSYDGYGGMTFTDVTTTFAKYCKIGKIVFFIIDFVGTTGGIASEFIEFTLPIAYSSDIDYCGGGCRVFDIGGSITISGNWYFPPEGYYVHVWIQRYDQAVFSIGSGVGASVQGFYKID